MIFQQLLISWSEVDNEQLVQLNTNRLEIVKGQIREMCTGKSKASPFCAGA